MDMFRCLTTGDGNNAVLMGYKTWESLPARVRPLPDRLNLVLSRTRKAEPSVYSSDLPLTFQSISELKEFVDELSSGKSTTHIDEVWIIGGAQIYTLALDNFLCDTIVITRFKSEFKCDTYFDVKSELHERNIRFDTKCVYEDESIVIERLEVKQRIVC
jgi:dihydrofolate reductase